MFFMNVATVFLRQELWLNVAVAIFFPTERGTWGGSEHRNTAKKINEHHITARKVNETPSPQHIFLVPRFVHLHLK